jgi:ubiquinone/menaquinone biosynthesis C-methylase UbiE
MTDAEFQVGSALRLPSPDGSFDVVYAAAVVLYLRALAEVRRVLRPGGIVAVADDVSTILLARPSRAVDCGRRRREQIW